MCLTGYCSRKSHDWIIESTHPMKMVVPCRMFSVTLDKDSSLPINHSDLQFQLPILSKDSNLVYCPTEEEIPNYQQCGDFEMSQFLCAYAQNEHLRRVYADETFHPVLGNTATSEACEPEFDSFALITSMDKPDHKLAGLKQLGDYPSQSIYLLCHQTRSQPTYEPGETTTNSLDIQGMSSTTVPNENAGGTSSTTRGMRWNNRECHPTIQNKSLDPLVSPVVSRPSRPVAPACFTLPPSSEALTSPGQEANMGQTSTTHEFRWTQIEQTTIEVDNVSDDQSIYGMTKGIGQGIFDTQAAEKYLCASYSTSSDCILRVNPSQRLDGATGRLENPNTSREITWIASDPSTIPLPHHSIPKPEIAPSKSFNGRDTQTGFTSLAVQHSLTQHIVNCPFTCGHDSRVASTCPPERRYCSDGEAERLWLTQQKHSSEKHGHFSTGSPELFQRGSDSQTDSVFHVSEKLTWIHYPCLWHLLPIGSEPAAVQVRLAAISRDASSPRRIFPSTSIQSHCDSAQTHTDSMAHLWMPNYHPPRLSTHASTLSTPAAFGPIEKLETIARTTRTGPTRIPRNGKCTDLYRLDINQWVEGIENITGLQKENRNFKWDQVFHCLYVEVSMHRNLDSVASPALLTLQESRAIHSTLGRRLHNAVATQFLSQSLAIRQSDSSSLSSTAGFPVIEGINVYEDTKRPRWSKQSYTEQLKTAVQRRGEIKNLIKQVSSKYKPWFLSRSRSSQGSIMCSNGAYVFQSGLRHVRPPRPWWNFIGKTTTSSSSNGSGHRSMVAWEIASLQLTVGGLLMHGDHHLQLIVSSNDGRLGMAYTQADHLLNELVNKSTRYVNKLSMGLSSIGRGPPRDSPKDMIRLFFRAPGLVSLLNAPGQDMAQACGLSDLGLHLTTMVVPGVKLALDVETAKNTVIVLQTARYVNIPDQEELRSLIVGLRRLRILSYELSQSTHRLKRHVMPVETLDFLYAMMRQNGSHLFSTVDKLCPLGSPLRNTTYHGTLAHCIRGNAYCPEELEPRACDPDAYEVYRHLFEPILHHYREPGSNFTTAMVGPQPATSYQLPFGLDQLSSLPNVLRYRVRFSRNLQSFGFYPVMTKRDYGLIEQLCCDALLAWHINGQPQGKCYKLTELSEQNPILYQSLIKKQLLWPLRSAMRKATGVYRHWPHGRSIFVAPGGQDSCDLVAQINGEDHLRVICIDWTGKKPFVAYQRAVELMSWLDQRLRFSKSPRWGYLSPIVTNLGTGMRVAAWLRVPHWDTVQTSRMERVCKRYKLGIRSLYPYGVSVMHTVYDVSPSMQLGKTESEMVLGFMQSLKRICQKSGRLISYQSERDDALMVKP